MRRFSRMWKVDLVHAVTHHWNMPIKILFVLSCFLMRIQLLWCTKSSNVAKQRFWKQNWKHVAKLCKKLKKVHNSWTRWRILDILCSKCLYCACVSFWVTVWKNLSSRSRVVVVWRFGHFGGDDVENRKSCTTPERVEGLLICLL